MQTTFQRLRSSLSVGLQGGQGVLATLAPWITPLQSMSSMLVQEDIYNLFPHLLPQIDQLFNLYISGRLTWEQFRYWSQRYGINTDIGGSVNGRGSLWRNIFLDAVPRIPIDQLVNNFYRGISTRADVDDAARIMGYTGVEKVNSLIQENRPFSEATLYDLYNKGQITLDEFQAQLKANGVTVASDRDLSLKLRWLWPGISDFQQWQLRGVENNAIAARYLLDDGYNATVQNWSAASGYQWKPTDFGYGTVDNPNMTMAQRYWRSSHNLMGLGQIFDAINRFAETQPGSGVSITPGIVPFTEQDFQNHMQWNGIAKGCWAWMRALAYLPINIRMVKALFTTGTYNRSQLKTAYQKQGFSPTDAESLTVAEEAIVWESNTKSGRERISKASAKLYGAGHIPIENLATAIYATTFTSQPQMLAFEALPVSQQQQTALADPTTAIELNAVQLELQVELSKQVVDSVHKQYVGSRVTWPQAQQVLIAAGILGNSIAQYKMVWDLEVVAKGREIGAAQLVSWYKSNIISRPLAMQRIILLGYSQPDADSMLTEADIAIQVQQQKAADRLAKAKEATTKQTKAALDNIAKIRSQLMASLNKEAGKTTLLKWYVQGIITEADTRSALYDRGFVEPYVSNYLKDACSSTAAQKKPGCQTPKAGDSPPANGQSGSTNGG